MLDRFKPEDVADMLALEQQLKVIFERAEHQNLEPAVAIFAMMRLSRSMLEMYPDLARSAMISAIVPFLRNDNVSVSDLWLQ